MKRGLYLGAAMSLCSLTAAEASDTVPWTPSSVQGWDLFVDRTLNNGCFIIAYFEGNTAFRIGFNRKANTAYLIVADDDWKSLEVSKEYEIGIQFDRQVPWEVTAEAIQMGEQIALWAQTQKVEFLDEFVRKHGMTVSYKNRTIASLSLKGTAAAISEMVVCQDAMDGKTSQNDPFQSSSDSGNDPFQ